MPIQPKQLSAGTDGQIIGIVGTTQGWFAPSSLSTFGSLVKAAVSVTFGDGTLYLKAGNSLLGIQAPYNMTITSMTIVADVPASAVVNVKKSTYSAWPATTSITGSDTPTLSSSQKTTDSTLTGWTTSISAGDMLDFVIVSVSSAKLITITLTGTKS